MPLHLLTQAEYRRIAFDKAPCTPRETALLAVYRHKGDHASARAWLSALNDNAASAGNHGSAGHYTLALREF